MQNLLIPMLGSLSIPWNEKRIAILDHLLVLAIPPFLEIENISIILNTPISKLYSIHNIYLSIAEIFSIHFPFLKPAKL